MRPLRVAVVNLTAGGLSGGYAAYLREALPRLAAHPGVEALLCVAPESFGVSSWLVGGPKVRVVTCRPYGPLRRRLEPAAEKILSGFSPDVVFLPAARKFVFAGAPAVVMVQNMQPLTGDAAGPGLKELAKTLLRRRELLAAVRAAAAVVAPTEFVRAVTAERAGMDPGKIKVIPFGLSPLPAKRRRPAAVPAELAGKFLFTAGSLEAYRGVEDLLRALTGLRPEGLPLLVAGAARPGAGAYAAGLRRLADGLDLGDRVRWLGQLPAEELSWCYANCAAFAATSRVESFCFVALEAMAHGANCVSSKSPCLPEIFGPAAEYYEAGDADGLRRGLERVLARGPQERAAAAAAARARAAAYSWEASVDSLVSLLAAAAGLKA